MQFILLLVTIVSCAQRGGLRPNARPGARQDANGQYDPVPQGEWRGTYASQNNFAPSFNPTQLGGGRKTKAEFRQFANGVQNAPRTRGVRMQNVAQNIESGLNRARYNALQQNLAQVNQYDDEDYDEDYDDQDYDEDYDQDYYENYDQDYDYEAYE